MSAEVKEGFMFSFRDLHSQKADSMIMMLLVLVSLAKENLESFSLLLDACMGCTGSHSHHSHLLECCFGN